MDYIDKAIYILLVSSAQSALLALFLFCLAVLIIPEVYISGETLEIAYYCFLPFAVIRNLKKRQS